MRKITNQALAVVSFLVLMAGVSIAQSVGMNVDIPFTFNLAEKVLPAGHYLILAPSGDNLKIMAPNGTAVIALTNQVNGKRPNGPGEVSFNCYGRRCFLSGFWTARTEVGQELFKGHLEKELSREKEQLAVITLRATPIHR